jgi:hypothetical protein
MSRRAATALALLALGGWTAASCHGRPPAADPVPCAPTAGALLDDGRADALAGEFRLTLVATHGPRSGRSVTGRLTLRPFTGDARPVAPSPGVRYPLYGAAELALDSVGAVAPGEIGRAEAAAPGVLVMEWRRTTPQPAPQITLRFGADANRGGPDRFDGAHLALRVALSERDRFAGSWDSGAGSDSGAGGYFCAQRAG